ncbi:MAG: Rid family detoxifying hydrolase [Bacteroidota bacterium]
MNLFRILLLFVFFGSMSCGEHQESHGSDLSNSAAQNDSAEKTTAPIFHASHEPSRKDRPFSDAVQVGNTFYLTGQIGLNHKTGEMAEGGIEAETRQTLENIKDVLAHHGLTMQQVVKATVILDTIADFGAFNDIYVTYFPQKPARTTFAVEDLARGAKIEIEVVAIGYENQ